MNIAQIILKELYAELNALGIIDEKLSDKLPKIAKSIARSITEDIKKNLSGKLCQLKPKNQVVIAEGRIRKDRFYHCCVNARNIGIYFEESAKKHDGKKVKIILEEI